MTRRREGREHEDGMFVKKQKEGNRSILIFAICEPLVEAGEELGSSSDGEWGGPEALGG